MSSNHCKNIILITIINSILLVNKRTCGCVKLLLEERQMACKTNRIGLYFIEFGGHVNWYVKQTKFAFHLLYWLTMSIPRSLITGITGMVGSHLAEYLLKNTDFDIYGMCRWLSPQNNVEHLTQRVNEEDIVFYLYGNHRDYIYLQNLVEQVKPDFYNSYAISVTY